VTVKLKKWLQKLDYSSKIILEIRLIQLKIIPDLVDNLGFKDEGLFKRPKLQVYLNLYKEVETVET